MAARSVELGIDTASLEAAVAVLDGDEVLVERRWTVETNYSRELLAGLDAALRGAGAARADLAAIAVDAGPGGYSGLRSGVATAQGLALALDIPLAGISRLELAAFPHLAQGRPVVSVHDPGGGRVAWAAYAAGAGAPVMLSEPRIQDVADCVHSAPPAALWCGDVTPELRERRDTVRGGDEDVPAAANVRRAADLVRLARLHDAYGDPAIVDVVYLRPPPITRPAHPRQHA